MSTAIKAPDPEPAHQYIVRRTVEACRLAKEAAGAAAEGIATGSNTLLGSLRQRERELDTLDMEIDAGVTSAITEVEPAEARQLLACMKFMIGLERIGDLLLSFANSAQAAGGRIDSEDTRDLTQMATILEKMLTDCGSAFSDREIGKAIDVLRADAEMDRLRNLIFLRHIENPENLVRQASLQVIFMTQSLERAGDHAKNLAEEVCHFVSGHTVRHVLMAYDKPVEQMFIDYLRRRDLRNRLKDFAQNPPVNGRSRARRTNLLHFAGHRRFDFRGSRSAFHMFRRLQFVLTFSLVASILAFTIGCGSTSKTTPSQNNVSVMATVPVAGATDVNTTTAIQISFSGAVNPATVNSTNIQVTDASKNAVAGTISYNATTNTASFAPSSALDANATFTVTVSSVASASGGVMATPFTETFTTAAAPTAATQYQESLFGGYNTTNGQVSVDTSGNVTIQLTGATASTTFAEYNSVQTMKSIPRGPHPSARAA